MPNMSAEDLAEHIKILDTATTADLDELLEDLLVRAGRAVAVCRGRPGRC